MANLFAQTNYGNWDSVNMWNTQPGGGGAFQTPGPTDVCIANGKNVYVNVASITVAELRNDTTGGATEYGGFFLTYVAGQQVITANLFANRTTVAGASTNLVVMNSSSSTSVRIIGTIRGGSSGGAALDWSKAGSTLQVDGNIYSGTYVGSHGVNITGSVTTLIVNGNLYACTTDNVNSNTNNCGAVYNSGYNITNVTITGDLYGGNWNAASAYYQYAGGTSLNNFTVIGNIYGGDGHSNGFGVNINVTTINTITVTGSFIGGKGAGAATISSSAGSPVVNINGNITGSVQIGLALNMVGMTCTITGNILSGYNTSAGWGFNPNGACSGTLIINGNISSINTTGMQVNMGSGAGLDITINGSLYGAVLGCGIGYGVNLTSNYIKTFILNGDCDNRNGGSTSLYIDSYGSVFGNPVTINGNVYGSNVFLSTGPGIYYTNNSVADLVINGNVYPGDMSHGIYVANASSSRSVTVNGTIYGGRVYYEDYTVMDILYGIYSTSVWSGVKVYARSVFFGLNGALPVWQSPLFMTASGVNTVQTYSNWDSRSTIFTYDEGGDPGDHPSVVNVKRGISYNNGNSIGTLDLPDPSNVVIGVPVGATVGTASLTYKTTKKALNSHSKV